MRPSKCTFFTDTEYLGHIIGPAGNPALIKAIVNFPQPQTLKELQSFLSLANFYRKFIESYSKIALPLTDALQRVSNSRPIVFTVAMIQAFENLKKAK